jgi:hypothetical protein
VDIADVDPDSHVYFETAHPILLQRYAAADRVDGAVEYGEGSVTIRFDYFAMMSRSLFL